MVKAIVAKADSSTSINRDLTYAELVDLTFSLEVGGTYSVELYLASTDKYSYDGLVVFGKSNLFTVIEAAITTITIPCLSAQWLVLVDKENNLGTTHYNAGPAPYETTLLYYEYEGEISETSIVIDCHPDGPEGFNNRFGINHLVSNTIYFIS